MSTQWVCRMQSTRVYRVPDSFICEERKEEEAREEADSEVVFDFRTSV
jgi:hypothetical protein